MVISFISPTRPLIELEKPLTDEGRGLFSFEVTSQETDEFIDNTYFCKIMQGDYLLLVDNVNIK